MYKKIFRLILIGAFSFMFFGCATRVMDFTIVSSKNVDFSKFPTYERGRDRVEGKDTKPIIFIIPLGNPDGKEAIDRAIETTPGAVALVDGVLTYKYFYIPYIYGEYTYLVEGTPLIDPALANADEIEGLSDYSICLLDRQGNLLKTLTLNEYEYLEEREKILNNPTQMYNKILKQN